MFALLSRHRLWLNARVKDTSPNVSRPGKGAAALSRRKSVSFLWRKSRPVKERTAQSLFLTPLPSHVSLSRRTSAHHGRYKTSRLTGEPYITTSYLPLKSNKPNATQRLQRCPRKPSHQAMVSVFLPGRYDGWKKSRVAVCLPMVFQVHT